MSVEVFSLSLRRVRQWCVLRSEGSDEAGEKVGALREHHGGAREEFDALLSMSLPRLQFSSVSWRLKYSLAGSRHHCDIRELTMKVGPAERCRCRPVPALPSAGSCTWCRPHMVGILELVEEFTVKSLRNILNANSGGVF